MCYKDSFKCEFRRAAFSHDHESKSMRFSKQFQIEVPTAIVLPETLLQTLDWVESNAVVQTFADGRQCALLYTPSEMEGGGKADLSSPIFQVFEDFYYDYADLSREAVKARLFLCVRTGGDGSHAGIWLDEAGVQKFVHIGSGSGSIWGGVITDNAIDFLRFLAIGYTEPAFSEYHDKNIEAAWFAYHGYELEDKAALIKAGAYHPTVPPRAFQKFLTDTFNVKIPERASEIIKHPVATYGNPQDDPFALWLKAISG